ncbi:MAG: DUF5683 domain-containing protein [Candidatus Zhuqueibacterota bacterium]
MPLCRAQVSSQDSSFVGKKNIKTNNSVEKKIASKSPNGAMIRSLIIPGWGQWYNKKKLKAVVVFGTETGILINSIYLNQMTQKSTTTAEREYYLNNRNLSNWWLVGALLFSVADAFVDAQLSDFDESPVLAFLEIRPTQVTAEPGVLLSLRFAF